VPPDAAELDSKVAVVTGGGGGLGSALARTFAAIGMSIAVLDIDAVAAENTAKTIADEFGVSSTFARVDVGDTASVANAAGHVEATLGRCDVLCANVGVQQFGAIDRLTQHDWEWVVNVNVLGTVRTVREFLPLLRAQSGWRRIVLTASSSVLAPSVRLGAYQTSKFAVTGFGETLRDELAPEGIGVTILFPGGMITRHLESSAQARPSDLTETGAAEDDLTAMLSHQPMGDGDVVMPEHAVRNLLADLMENAPYSVTHGSFRPVYERRRAAMDAAFDRMERS
jgi:NAD(P)-dependent dehydrogenase (short-subunit alcohol dehydrogenase family)